MSTTSVQARRACGLTRGEFAQFIKDVKKGEVDFGTYFFTNAPGTKKHQTRDDLDNEVVRCLECGCTIGEHLYAGDSLGDRLIKDAFAENPYLQISQTHSSRAPHFKRDLSAAWVQEQDVFQYCPVLLALYRKLEFLSINWKRMITAAHIIPHCLRNHTVVRAMKFNVDDVQNGLLICKVFEAAFDQQQWCFEPGDALCGPFKIALMDQSIFNQDVVLVDNEGRYMQEQPAHLKWGDLHGLVVQLPTCVSRRALVYHTTKTFQRHNNTKIDSMNFDVWKVRLNSPASILEWLKDVPVDLNSPKRLPTDKRSRKFSKKEETPRQKKSLRR